MSAASLALHAPTRIHSGLSLSDLSTPMTRENTTPVTHADVLAAKERMLDLARQIRERGLHRMPWGMMARGDCMSRTMIDAFAEAGMYSVKYGVESISVKLTDFYKYFACTRGRT